MGRPVSHRRFLRRSPRSEGHPLREEEAMRSIYTICLDIGQSISLRPDFSKFTEIDIRRAWILLQRYKIDYMEELRSAKKRHRGSAIDDLRENVVTDCPPRYMAPLEMSDLGPQHHHRPNQSQSRVGILR